MDISLNSVKFENNIIIICLTLNHEVRKLKAFSIASVPRYHKKFLIVVHPSLSSHYTLDMIYFPKHNMLSLNIERYFMTIQHLCLLRIVNKASFKHTYLKTTLHETILLVASSKYYSLACTPSIFPQLHSLHFPTFQVFARKQLLSCVLLARAICSNITA